MKEIADLTQRTTQNNPDRTQQIIEQSSADIFLNI
jgi:hypothetical protein